MNSLTDEYAAILKLQEGNEDGLAVLIELHNPLLCGIVRKMIPNQEVVDDILQDVWLEIFRKILKYNPRKGRFVAWVATLARRRAIDHIRARDAYNLRIERFRISSNRATEASECLRHEIATHDYYELLERLLSEIPPPQAQAVRLVYYEGMTYRKMAATTGIPLGTVRTRLLLGRKKLQEKLRALNITHY